MTWHDDVRARVAAVIRGGMSDGKHKCIVVSNDDAVALSKLMHEDLPRCLAWMERARVELELASEIIEEHAPGYSVWIADAEDLLAELEQQG